MYAESLVKHLHEVYSSVQRTALSAIEREESKLGGRLSSEIGVGDAVLVRREATVERKGPTRFQERVYEGIFRVVRRASPGAFWVEDLVDKTKSVPFRQPVHAERLVKLDMPELELRADQPRKLEVREAPTQPWNRYVIDRFGVDGRVRLRYEGGGKQTNTWVDLTQVEYRWLA